MCCFEASVQLVPKFTSFLQPAWIETGSIVNPSPAAGCVQLYIESETGQRTISRYFLWNNHTEIIILGEHGGCGGNFPISHFLMSLAHSALAVASREREHFKPSLTDLFSGGVEWFGETGRQLFPAFTGGNSPTFILNICSDYPQSFRFQNHFKQQDNWKN